MIVVVRNRLTVSEELEPSKIEIIVTERHRSEPNTRCDPSTGLMVSVAGWATPYWRVTDGSPGPAAEYVLDSRTLEMFLTEKFKMC